MILRKQLFVTMLILSPSIYCMDPGKGNINEIFPDYKKPELFQLDGKKSALAGTIIAGIITTIGTRETNIMKDDYLSQNATNAFMKGFAKAFSYSIVRIFGGK